MADDPRDDEMTDADIQELDNSDVITREDSDKGETR